MVVKRSKEAVDQAVQTSKRSAELRDQADLLARESEAAIEKARRVKRGEQPGE